MRDYDAAMKAGMAEEYGRYKDSGFDDRAAVVADELWSTYGVDVDGSRQPKDPEPAPEPTREPVLEPAPEPDPEPDVSDAKDEADEKSEPRQKRKYTRRQPLERADQKAPETVVEGKPAPRVGE